MNYMEEDVEFFSTYLEEKRLIQSFFEELGKIKTDWTEFACEENKEVYHKQEEGSSTISVFTKFKVDTSLFYPMAMLNEIDNFKEWVPTVVKSDILKEISEDRKVVYMERELPPPFAHRELFIHVSRTFLKEKKGVLYMMRSLTDETAGELGMMLPPENEEEKVRAQMVKGFMYIEAIDKNSCMFHQYLNMNPKMKLMPDWLLNFSVKNVLYILINKLQNKEAFKNEVI